MKRGFLFAAVALALMLVVAGCGGGGAAGGGSEIKLTASDYKFTPADITVKRGEAVTIALENKGSVEHDWASDPLNA
ncbi:MAG: cupredoxin domain-containing protein, partial [Chloroflexota bacterium]